MRFFRGITVAAENSERVISDIRLKGLASDQGWWKMTHEHPGDLKSLFVKPDLSPDDTRPGAMAVAAVCACGDETGALYYGISHNRSAENDTPIFIEFEAELSQTAVDGKDFLYTAFQMADPVRARPVLERCFGAAILKYADRAWSTEDQSYRIAQCDLAIHDSDVVAAHHSNQLVLAGRHKTLFRSAFTVALPVQPEAIVKVFSPVAPYSMPRPDVMLRDILRVS